MARLAPLVSKCGGDFVLALVRRLLVYNGDRCEETVKARGFTCAPRLRRLHGGWFLTDSVSAASRARLLQPTLHSRNSWILWLGAGLTFAGTILAIWARATIGKNWSAEVQIKQDHQLIRTGPHAHIRHPIYTGILLAVGGSALAVGEYRALLGLAVLGIGFIRKARKEESFLAVQFGRAFEDHQRHTGFFFPRFS